MAQVIIDKVKNALPVIEELSNSLNNIKYITPEEDELACLMSFEKINGIEPCIEICYFQDRNQQHVRLEIESDDGNLFAHEEFITSSNQSRVVKTIKDFIDKAYIEGSVNSEEHIMR